MTSISPAIASAGPEIELLLCCARTQLSPDTADRIQALLRQKVDWSYLLRLAERHRIRPLLYWHLKEVGRDAVPKEVLDHLGNLFRRNIQFNLSLTGELLALLSLFEAHAIPAIPFKGPALAEAVYGNLALREFGDLDILVPQRDISKAKDLLIARGYRTQFQLSREQEVGYLESQCEYYFERADRYFPVEIHWRLFPRYFTFALNPALLWGRLMPVSLGQKPVQTFSPEDLLLYLSAHGTKHGWSRLGWVCDISELIRVHPGINWAGVIQQASALGGKRMLYLGLLLAQDLFGTKLPNEVQQQMQTDSAIPALAQQVLLAMTHEADGPLRDIDLKRLIFPLRVRERLRDRVTYCSRLIIFPTDGERWSRVHLPLNLFPLYYLLWRPIGLVIRCGSYLLRNLCKSPRSDR